MANSSFKIRLKNDAETRLGQSVKRKRMSRPRKRLSCGQGRDFFLLAAAFANAEKRESDFGEQTRRAPKDALIELASSKFLQADYQERSPLFVIKQRNAQQHEMSSFEYSVMEKWQRAEGPISHTLETLFLEVDVNDVLEPAVKDGFIKNGVHFNARESEHVIAVAQKIVVREYLSSAALVQKEKISAVDFHQTFKACIEQRKPFICASSNDKNKSKFIVQRARLFWSHRLRTKALQATNTAEPSICYFHAALRAETAAFGEDLLYWLRLNDEKKALEGDFINLEDTMNHAELFFPQTLLFDKERLNTCLATLDSPNKLFVLEVNRLLTH